jgi:hypothetical protein
MLSPKVILRGDVLEIRAIDARSVSRKPRHHDD